MNTYSYNVLDACSHLLNAILGRMPVESVSGYSYRTGSKLEYLINILFFDSKHCEVSHINDVSHAKKLIEESK